MTTQNDQFANLAIVDIVASRTNPRKTFDPISLQQLADSIKDSGVHQPILVRPLPAERLEETSALQPRPGYELVAGERRYRASKLAGVATIPALIRTLDDDTVLDIQIIENLQRDDLNDLEAAEGYQTLMDRLHISKDEVADRIKKSRTFVYNSLKLLTLSPDAKAALRTKDIGSSIGQLIARIPNDALQAKALEFALQPDGDGDKPSYRAFSHWLQRNVMLSLVSAPFPIKIVNLTPNTANCLACDKRTGYNPDLFADVKVDMCTNPPCYQAKAQQHSLNEAAKVKAIPKERNANVEDQAGLGLESTLTQDARQEQARLAQAARDQAAKDPANRLKHDIERLKEIAAVKTDDLQRLACADACIDYIYELPADRTALLITPELLRAWLPSQFDDYDNMAMAFDLPPPNLDGSDWKARQAITDAFEEQCRLRIQRASDADIYRYAAACLILPDREVYTPSTDKIQPAVLFDVFAKDQNIDLVAVRKQAANEVEDDTAEQLAELNKKLKAIEKSKTEAKKAKSAAAETTSTPNPAGAAIDTGEAALKTGAKNKPAALPRKAKTSAQEAISGIAAAMQGIEAAPLDASLGGAEAAAIKVGAVVKVTDGKHKGKQGIIANEVGSEMWNVNIGSAANMFSIYLPTKSIEVVSS